MEHVELQTLTPTLATIPQENLSYPTMPVEIFLNEAEALTAHIETDAPQFEKLRLNSQELSTELRNAVSALRSAEILWQAALSARTEEQKIWADNEQIAYDLRDSSLDRLDFYFEMQNSQDNLRQVDQIRAGAGAADMILDLGKITNLLDLHSDELDQSIGFTHMEQAEIREMYTLLTRAYGSATAARQDAHEERLLRDRAFAHLEMLIRRVKKAVKIIWRGNSEEQKKYRSMYQRRKYLRSQRASEVQPN